MEDQVESAVTATAPSAPVTEPELASLSMAPRVTPADIEANIVEAVYISPGDSLRPGHPAALLTLCILVLNNGFTVVGQSACASPENFDAEIGRRIAREDAVRKVWPLMGYELRMRLHLAESVQAAEAKSISG